MDAPAAQSTAHRRIQAKIPAVADIGAGPGGFRRVPDEPVLYHRHQSL